MLHWQYELPNEVDHALEWRNRRGNQVNDILPHRKLRKIQKFKNRSSQRQCLVRCRHEYWAFSVIVKTSRRFVPSCSVNSAHDADKAAAESSRRRYKLGKCSTIFLFVLLSLEIIEPVSIWTIWRDRGVPLRERRKVANQATEKKIQACACYH